MKRLSWFVCFSIFAVSCLDKPDCYQLNNNVAAVGFKIIGGGADQIALSAPVTSPGAKGDIAEKGVVSSVQLSLNPYAAQSDYIFQGSFMPYGQEETKHLNFSYKALVQFVSEDCGERHVFSDMAVTFSDFDSVRILNTVPTNPPSVNFDVYRCPRTDLIRLDFVPDMVLNTIKGSDGSKYEYGGLLTGAAVLIVDTTATKTDYIFNFPNGVVDTLSIKYQRTYKSISPVCGKQIFVDGLANNPEFTKFKVTLKNDSTYDLPTIVNFEVSH